MKTIGERMIREEMMKRSWGLEPDFRWRGVEVSRVEGFADGVFAFGITLLIVSLEIPKDYGELITSLYDFPAFAICFALLATVWFEQYKIFRRYGFQDFFSLVMNFALLFVVLFFLYPLKFIFT